MDLIEIWLREHHPNLQFVEGDPFNTKLSTFCLIGKPSNRNFNQVIDEVIHEGQDAQIVEIDFDRKPGTDWFFSYHDYRDGKQDFLAAKIADPDYFIKLEQVLTQAGLV